MGDELRRLIIRGHEKVIDHCRFLLASPNLEEAERVRPQNPDSLSRRGL